MYERKKLTDILSPNSGRESLERAWKTTTAAAEFAPLPKGEYTFRILSGELFTSKRGTPGYKLTLEVTEGDFEGRRVWCDLWLTPAALPMTKRDLLKIGITNLEQVEQPLPAGILIKGKLALRTHDDGNDSNRLVRFECLGVEPGDAFGPKEDAVTVSEKNDNQSNEQRQASETLPNESFPFGANAAPPLNGTVKPEEATP
jgi:hypothetical protein